VIIPQQRAILYQHQACRQPIENQLFRYNYCKLVILAKLHLTIFVASELIRVFSFEISTQEITHIYDLDFQFGTIEFSDDGIVFRCGMLGTKGMDDRTDVE
jgi:hypothetical protein